MGERDSIGVGLVGYGLAGRAFHAPFIEAVDGLVLQGIVTSDADRAAHAASEHPTARIVGDIDDLLRSDDIHLIVVATPNRLHVPLGRRALAAGKHVVVDKPIGLDSAEGETLITEAEDAGRVLSVFQNRRWDGDFLTLRDLIERGALGMIDSFESRFERWAPAGDGWRDGAAEAGGPVRDLGAHLVDQCLVLFGPVDRVWAQIDRRRPGSQVDDAAFMALDHACGVRSRLWMSLIASRTGPRLRVRGLGGEYLKEGLDIQEPRLVEGVVPTTTGFGDEPPKAWGSLRAPDGTVTPIPTKTGRYIAFYEGMRDAIRGDRASPVDPQDSVEVLRILEAAERSACSSEAQNL